MLDESPLAVDWLSQFSLIDRQIGKQFLRALRLISTSDFDRHLDETLNQLMVDLGDEMVAVFSVPELISAKRQERYPEKEFRVAGSSSHRMQHFLENFARVRSRRVRAHPTVESMRAERIKNIVLVEDFIGSGTRISTFLKKLMHPSIKSWISYGWAKLWIVGYGGLRNGVWNIQRCGYKLSDARFRFVVPPTYATMNFSEPILSFCSSNAGRTNRSQIPFGFNNGGSNLIFEHGCPNNAPVILWAQGRKPLRSETRFRPLFPNRGIPTELREAFGAPTPQLAPEALWSAGQYRLALSLLDDRNDARRIHLWPVPVALGLASRGKWDDVAIATAIGKPLLVVTRLREDFISMGAIDATTREVTSFGRTLLDQIRIGSQNSPAFATKTSAQLSELYYPHSCEGRAQH